MFAGDTEVVFQVLSRNSAYIVYGQRKSCPSSACARLVFRAETTRWPGERCHNIERTSLLNIHSSTCLAAAPKSPILIGFGRYQLGRRHRGGKACFLPVGTLVFQSEGIARTWCNICEGW